MKEEDKTGIHAKLKVEHAQSKDFVTMQFIVAVLKQHEKEFDRLINKLSEVTSELRETELVVRRIEKIDKKLEELRSEITNMTKCRSLGR